jgi:Xaa-Pro dipeptidase
MEVDSSTFEYACRLPNSLFRESREKFLREFKEHVPEFQKAIMMFKGKEEIPIDSTDFNYEIKQESFFYYLFGVQEPGCTAVIDIENDKTTVFFPQMDEIYKIWMDVRSNEELLDLYPDFEIKFVDDLEQWIKDLNPSQIFINSGINTDSGLNTVVPEFKWLEEYKIEKDTMHDILSECRVIKSEEELKILEIANDITSEAHCYTMQFCKPGIRESLLSAKFRSYCLERYNCKILPYQTVCA